MDQAEIAARHAAAGELGGQRIVGALGLGQDDEPGRALVEPVDDAGAPRPAHARHAGGMRERRGGERPRRLAGARMRDHAGVLVHHEDVLVLEDDAQRDRLGRHLLGRKRWNLGRDRLARAEPMRGLRRPPVDRGHPLVDQLPDPGARQLGQARREPLVEPRPALRRDHRGANVPRARLAHRADPEAPAVPGRPSPGPGGGVTRSLRASRATPTLMAESATLNAGQW